jgi:Tfp pilus assembly protein PilO
MKATDRTILMVILAAGLLVAFYLMMLKPKQQEASKLGDEVAALEAAITEQEQVAAFAEQARQDFPRYYGRMVVLGKAVPEGADSASMLVQVNSISNRAGTEFKSLQLGTGSGSQSTAPTQPTQAPPPAEGSAPSGTSTTSSGGAAPAPTTGSSTPAASSSTPAPATETAAANLPIGATVGPAGLPTLPYDLFLKGSFFQIADFISGVDGMVHVGDGEQVGVDGRLLTIDGFSLQGGAPGSNPTLEAQFATTTYVTPSEQGLALGASPSGPASPGQPQITQTSSPAVVP